MNSMNTRWFVLTFLLAAAALSACGRDLPVTAAADGATVTEPASDSPSADAIPPMPEGYSSNETLKLAALTGQLKLIEQPDVPDSVIETKDIEYSNIDGVSLKLDMYQPRDLASPAPALVFIHGGAWEGGERDVYKAYTVPFAVKGYVTTTISYRLSSVAPFPAAVHDVKNAIMFLKANAEKYKIDPERIAVLGGSAGGHLAMMAGYAQDEPALEPPNAIEGVNSKVQAVVDFYGPVDLTAQEARVHGGVRKFLQGKTYEEAPDLYRQASPTTYLTSDDPPTLILHGSIDDVVPIAQAELLAAKLAELGIPHVYERFEGWPHTMDLAQPVFKRAVYDVETFLKEHLKQGKVVASAP